MIQTSCRARADSHIDSSRECDLQQPRGRFLPFKSKLNDYKVRRATKAGDPGVLGARVAWFSRSPGQYHTVGSSRDLNLLRDASPLECLSGGRFKPSSHPSFKFKSRRRFDQQGVCLLRLSDVKVRLDRLQRMPPSAVGEPLKTGRGSEGVDFHNIELVLVTPPYSESFPASPYAWEARTGVNIVSSPSAGLVFAALRPKREIRRD